jgi:hypothetical protein
MYPSDFRSGTWPLAIHRMRQSLRYLARQQGECAVSRDAHASPGGTAAHFDGDVSVRNHLAREPYNYIQFSLYRLGHYRAAAVAAEEYLRFDPGNDVRGSDGT